MRHGIQELLLPAAGRRYLGSVLVGGAALTVRGPVRVRHESRWSKNRCSLLKKWRSDFVKMDPIPQLGRHLPKLSRFRVHAQCISELSKPSRDDLGY
jgi:hypothetical protein